MGKTNTDHNISPNVLAPEVMEGMMEETVELADGRTLSFLELFMGKARKATSAVSKVPAIGRAVDINTEAGKDAAYLAVGNFFNHALNKVIIKQAEKRAPQLAPFIDNTVCRSAVANVLHMVSTAAADKYPDMKGVQKAVVITTSMVRAEPVSAMLNITKDGVDPLLTLVKKYVDIPDDILGMLNSLFSESNSK